MFFGVLLLAENLGIINTSVSHVIFSWQMLLIVIGLLGIINRRGVNPGSIILIGLGVFFLIPDIFDVTFDVGRLFLPFIFVIIGISILFHSHRDHDHWRAKCRADWRARRYHRYGHNWKYDYNWKEGTNTRMEDTNAEQKAENLGPDFINESNVFNGNDKKIISKNFRGGKITNVFGGGTYDFLDCELAEGKNVLEMENIFGGVKLLIPSDWVIHLDISAVFGGFADKRRRMPPPTDPSKKELYITGVAIFGGGEIKSMY
jgi:predicted membrane protein